MFLVIGKTYPNFQGGMRFIFSLGPRELDYSWENFSASHRVPQGGTKVKKSDFRQIWPLRPRQIWPLRPRRIFTSLNSSHDFLSVIFGILGKFGIGIGHQKKKRKLFGWKFFRSTTFQNFSKSQKFSKFSKSKKLSKFSKISKFENFSKCQNVEFSKKIEIFEIFEILKILIFFFSTMKKYFSSQFFFNDLDYVSRVPENYLEHSMMSSEEDIDRVWGAFSWFSWFS